MDSGQLNWNESPAPGGPDFRAELINQLPPVLWDIHPRRLGKITAISN